MIKKNTIRGNIKKNKKNFHIKKYDFVLEDNLFVANKDGNNYLLVSYLDDSNWYHSDDPNIFMKYIEKYIKNKKRVKFDYLESGNLDLGYAIFKINLKLYKSGIQFLNYYPCEDDVAFTNVEINYKQYLKINYPDIYKKVKKLESKKEDMNTLTLGYMGDDSNRSKKPKDIYNSDSDSRNEVDYNLSSPEKVNRKKDKHRAYDKKK